MHIIAFAGSNSKQSINKKLVTHAASYFTNESVEILDLNDYQLPVFGVDLEKEIGVHENAKKFADKIDSADLLIISLAEHNGAYSTVFKNTFDWISRIKERKAFGNKPMFLLSTSDGKRGGAGVMEIALKRLPFSGGIVIEHFSLPSFKDNFDETNGIISTELKTEFEEKIILIKKHFEEIKKDESI